MTPSLIVGSSRSFQYPRSRICSASPFRRQPIRRAPTIAIRSATATQIFRIIQRWEFGPTPITSPSTFLRTGRRSRAPGSAPMTARRCCPVRPRPNNASILRTNSVACCRPIWMARNSLRLVRQITSSVWARPRINSPIGSFMSIGPRQATRPSQDQALSPRQTSLRLAAAARVFLSQEPREDWTRSRTD